MQSQLKRHRRRNKLLLSKQKAANRLLFCLSKDWTYAKLSQLDVPTQIVQLYRSCKCGMHNNAGAVLRKFKFYKSHFNSANTVRCVYG
jgi:hypothetical protein